MAFSTKGLLEEVRANGAAHVRAALTFLAVYFVVWVAPPFILSMILGAEPAEGGIRVQNVIVELTAALTPVLGVLAGRVTLDQQVPGWAPWAAFAPLAAVNLADLTFGIMDAAAPGAATLQLALTAARIALSLAAGWWWLLRKRAE